MIVSLDDFAACDVRLSGGKAAALAALIAAKFPVPEGFLVTTPEEPDLIARLNALENSIEPDSLFAVRSSGYAEDSANSSFAGQFETVLAVKGPIEVSNAVARCFASFSNSRSAAYRERKPSSQGGAVIVQRLVEAEAAGVAFSLDPLTGVRDVVVIEANFGLGDSVVGGHVNPDGFTVTKKTGEIVQRRIGDKRVRSIVAVNGSRLDPLPEHLLRAPSLSDEAIRTVADLARRVEEHHGGAPVDIEWAWKNGRAWLLQARPVTTSGTIEEGK